MYKKRKSFEAYAKSNHFKKVLETIIQGFLFFCILSVVNYLAFKNAKQFDLTENKINSLSIQTKNLLHSLKSPLNFKLFARKSEKMNFLSLLELYRMTGKNISVEVYDPDLHPDLVQKYGIRKSGTTILSYQDKMSSVVGLNEKVMSTAILNLSRSDKLKIYFTVGHGEHDLNDDSGEGASKMAKMLKDHFYELGQLNLMSSKNIPADASLVVILGPIKPFSESEIKMLDEYLLNGGNLLVAVSPNLKYFIHEKLSEMIKKYGIVYEHNIVVDRISNVNGSNGWVPIVHSFDKSHPITKDQKLPIFFPLSSSVKIFDLNQKNFKLKELAFTNLFPAAWAETNMKMASDGKLIYDELEDYRGPVPMMASSESDKNRIVAFGSGSFIKNDYSNQGGNFGLFLDSVSWLVKEEFIISNEKFEKNKKLVLLSYPQISVIFYFSVIFCPLFLYGISFYMYRRRYVA